MKNLFQISIEPERESQEIEPIIQSFASLLNSNLKAESIRRYLKNTIVFSTSKNYFEVIIAVKAWAEQNGVYFVITQALPNEDGVRYYYTRRGYPA